MTTLQRIYEKDNVAIRTHDKFIYSSIIYKFWNGGTSLVEEKYYSSDKPIIIKKKDLRLKRKGYFLYRFFHLEYAPEDYLIRNGYKLIENETDCD